MEHLVNPTSHAVEAYRIRSVEISRPLVWISRGWKDLIRAMPASLAYGIAFALSGYLLVAFAWQRTYLVTALVSGLFLVGPFLAIGLYSLSRRLERGEPATLRHSLTAWRGNGESIGLFGLLLAFILVSWERLSAILFALFYGGDLPTLQNFVQQVLFSGGYPQLVIAYLGAGGLVAALVFAISVVSVPMLLDRPVDPVTAMVTSVLAVSANLAAMALWAAIIVALTLIGFATFLLGLVILLPLLGHASWHAYRDLVE